MLDYLDWLGSRWDNVVAAPVFSDILLLYSVKRRGGGLLVVGFSRRLETPPLRLMKNPAGPVCQARWAPSINKTV